MRVTVVICGYDPALSDDLVEAVESVLAQTHDDVEVVVVVDGTWSLFETLEGRYAGHSDVALHCNDQNLGLSRSRNVGIDLATGDVVAFMDDDAVARDDWIEELLQTYRRHDALATGGRMAPRWVAGKPEFLPEEFYWLIGVTHRGYPETECEVRNTFGSNISFRADVLTELGGFKPELGLVGESQVQGEETELAARLRDRYGEGVWYNPDAVVEHKIFDYRTDPVWLVKRAFWQGYSKSIMQRFLPSSDADDVEADYLETLFRESIPDRVKTVLGKRSLAAGTQLAALVGLTAAVGFGYVYGELRNLS